MAERTAHSASGHWLLTEANSDQGQEERSRSLATLAIYAPAHSRAYPERVKINSRI
jgi:hypothetical protein